MSIDPLVSIIVPVFNDDAFLPIALASLACQTHANIEVVISDDASTDTSLATAQSFAQRDPRFRVVANVQNVGMTRNWNRALREARGEYLVKLDSDDAFRPDTLAQLVAAMAGEKRPVVAYCRTLDCDANLEPYSSYRGEQAMIRARMDPMQPHCHTGHAWYALSFDDIQIWHSNAQMHRRETLQQMGGWDESWGCASDTDLILRVLERNELVCHVPYAGVLYRTRPGSVSDLYRKQGWLQWESALVHLASLARYRASGGHLGLHLSNQWSRFWNNLKQLTSAGDAGLRSLRSDVRERLLSRAALVQPPPVKIRAAGALRRHLHRLRQRRS